VMTGGGPYRSTELAAITVWREAFARLHLGSAAALAVALFAVLLVLTLAYGRLARDEPGGRGVSPRQGRREPPRAALR